MTTNAYSYSLGPASLGPVCAGCGPCFIEQMSEAHPALCIDCAEVSEARLREYHSRQEAAEFRYASRYWLAVRPVLQTRLCDLVDERDAADALIEASERARYLLGERYYDTSTRVDPDASASNHDRDSRALGSR